LDVRFAEKGVKIQMRCIFKNSDDLDRSPLTSDIRKPMPIIMPMLSTCWIVIRWNNFSCSIGFRGITSCSIVIIVKSATAEAQGTASTKFSNASLDVRTVGSSWMLQVMFTFAM